MKIRQTVLNSIIEHAQRELPNEACGYLAELNEVVSKHYELTNLDKTHDHFSMDPKEQFAAVKDMRKQGMTLRAVYHSHPDTPARPSKEDIKLAYDPTLCYVIVSLAQQKKEVEAFRIIKGKVDREPIEIVG